MADLFAMKTPSGQLDPRKLTYPILVQPKLDGLRGICRVTPQGKVWFSFTGKPLWNLSPVQESIPRGVLGVFDGEIVWPGHPFSDAYGICKRQGCDDDTALSAMQLRYRVFDHLTLTEWTERQCVRPYQDRVANLLNMKFGKAIEAVGVDVADSPEELERWYRLYLAAGHEGLMAKSPDGLYYWKRHADWQRYKPTVTHDVRVIAVYEENDKHGDAKGTLGGCLVSVPAEDGFPEATCKVGGGFKAAERKSFWTPERASKWMTYEGVPMHDGSPLVGQVIEVVSKCRNPSGALREPHFVRLRPDKD